jgi:putative Holliday junction resolvase
MVWLGVDLGDARVGLALSDPELTFAHPAGNLDARGDYFRALDAAIETIENNAAEGNPIDHIVVGLPLQLDGSEGKSAKKARRWAANLTRRLTTLGQDESSPIHNTPSMALIDERLTTVSAHRQLHEAHVAGRAHRPVVDQQSAVVILQSALDARTN